MNEKYKNLISHLSQNPENIATRRVQYLIDQFDFNQVKTILDIGSWHLKQTIEFSQIFEFATIHAFEPNPETFNYCNNVLEKLPNHIKHRISIHEIALTDYIGKASFYPLDKSRTHSTNEGIASLNRLRESMDGSLLNDKWIQKEIQVETDTLSNWCFNNAVIPDLIWMDVQGAELNVLRGAGTTLRDVKAICTEAGLVPYYENHSLKQDIDTFMRENDFIELENAFTKTSWSSDKAAEADVIYINKRFV
jgi:FkbM family methyltransferase